MQRSNQIIHNQTCFSHYEGRRKINEVRWKREDGRGIEMGQVRVIDKPSQSHADALYTYILGIVITRTRPRYDSRKVSEQVAEGIVVKMNKNAKRKENMEQSV